MCYPENTALHRALGVRDRLRHAYKSIRRNARIWATRVSGRLERPDIYPGHPDPQQEAQFFQLLGEALEAHAIKREDVELEIQRGHVRSDLLECVDRELATGQ